MTKQIRIGDSTRGYDNALVNVRPSGKIAIIEGSYSGRITIIKKCIANYNRGIMTYTTSAGDELPITVS